MTRTVHPCRNAGVATLACLLVMAVVPIGARAKVYFSAFLAQGGTGIERAGPEGGGLETLQSEPAGFEDDLALDMPAGKMYWTDTNASVISSANLNGTDTQIVLDDFGEEPLGIALDVASGKMYWTDSEGIKRANLDGTEQELLTKEPARGFIALDLAAKRMYWADWPSGTIKTAAIGPEPAVTNLVTKQAAPFGIAVDDAGGKVYWLELNFGKKKSEMNEIRRANLDGSEIQTIVERPGAGFEGGLAIDPGAGKVYWSESEAHDIGVSNLDGSQAQTLFSTGQDSPEGLAVETVDPRPTNTDAPFIEGSAQVGNPLSCNPGTWTGTGPVSFGYRWEIVGGTAIEGATGSAYVPSAEEADSMLACVVTAADNVDMSTATSAPVLVSAFPSGPVVSPPIVVPVVQARLIAAIAFAKLTSLRTTALVPVFASLPGTATLKATPIGKHTKATNKGRSNKRTKPKTVTAIQKLRAGRDTIALKKLVPGTTYRLVLTIESPDGQTASDTATLKIARR